jgi:hypothetical protein
MSMMFDNLPGFCKESIPRDWHMTDEEVSHGFLSRVPIYLYQVLRRRMKTSLRIRIARLMARYFRTH